MNDQQLDTYFTRHLKLKTIVRLPTSKLTSEETTLVELYMYKCKRLHCIRGTSGVTAGPTGLAVREGPKENKARTVL